MEGTHRELKVLEYELQHLKGSPRARCPVVLQDVAVDGGQITLSTKMATLLHIDGTTETDDDGDRHKLTSTPLPPAPDTSCQLAMHTKESTTSTDRFMTPLTSMPSSHGSSSLRSYLHSRPHSRITPFSKVVLAEAASAVNWVNSDTVLGRMHRSGTTSDIDSGLRRSAVYAPKFETWSGRTKTHPFTSKDRLEQLGDADIGCRYGFEKQSSSRVLGDVVSKGRILQSTPRQHLHEGAFWVQSNSLAGRSMLEEVMG